MTQKEAFAILEIPENADRAQIRHAYSEKSKIYHVETHPEEFRRLHQAYKIALAQIDKTTFTEPSAANSVTHTDSAKHAHFVAHADPAKHTDSVTHTDPVKHTGSVDHTDPAKNTSSVDHTDPAKLTSSVDHTDPAKHTGSVDHTTSAEQTAARTAESTHSKTSTLDDDLLDRLVHDSFSIRGCFDIIQLIYHKCRYDETALTNTGTAFGSIITKKGNVWQNAPTDDSLFFGIPWRIWKAQDWTALICHPDFLSRQYTSAFLDELCSLLHEESLCSHEGIGRNFYLSLCISYGFFYDGTQIEDSRLQEIEYFLASHLKRQQYIFDLHNRPSLQEARTVTLFCQRALSLSGEKEILDFLNTAEEMLLSENILQNLTPFQNRDWKAYESASSWKRFIFQNFNSMPDELFSKGFTRFLEIRETQQKYAQAFIDTVLSCADIGESSYGKDTHSAETVSLHNGTTDYGTLSSILRQFRTQYLAENNWREFICRPVFFHAIKAYILSQNSNTEMDNGNSYPAIRFVPYKAWQQLRIWFKGNSPFLAEATSWLKSGCYFPEYEKRYQKERFWKAARVKEIFFEETLPVPRPDHEKRKLLRAVKKGNTVDVAQIQSAFLKPILTNKKVKVPFLTRLAYTMVHFRFLQYTPADGLPGGIFCFLKKEVILYQQKDNLVCHLSHEVFFDIISIYFDRIVYSWNGSKDGGKTYSEEFLDNACRNLYCYECFVHSDLN